MSKRGKERIKERASERKKERKKENDSIVKRGGNANLIIYLRITPSPLGRFPASFFSRVHATL